MKLEIYTAFCLPPNLCAAIINVISIVSGNRVYLLLLLSQQMEKCRKDCSAHPISV